MIRASNHARELVVTVTRQRAHIVHRLLHDHENVRTFSSVLALAVPLLCRHLTIWNRLHHLLAEYMTV